MTARARDDVERVRVRRDGAVAATDVFQQLLREARDGGGPWLTHANGSRSDASFGQPFSPEGGLGAAVGSGVGDYIALLRQAVDVLGAAFALDGRQDMPWTGQTPVRLSGRAGEVVQGRIWVHNTGVLEADVRLRMTALTSSSGRCVEPEAGVFSPSAVLVPASASTSSLLLVRFAPALPGDTYVGYVLAEGLPDAVLPLHAVVAP
jgi:hypothetical protein